MSYLSKVSFQGIQSFSELLTKLLCFRSRTLDNKMTLLLLLAHGESKKSWGRLLKMKEVGIQQTPVKMELYVLRSSKQKLIGASWSENFLNRNFLLIKGYIMMSW